MVMQANFGEKAIACLEYAEHISSPALQALFARWSEKAIVLKLTELTRRGYLDYGTWAGTPWLTDKGRAALAAIRAARMTVAYNNSGGTNGPDTKDPAVTAD